MGIRQRRKIEWLEANLEIKEASRRTLLRLAEEQQAEIERLTEENKKVSAYIGSGWGYVSFLEFVKKQRAEAIKEFAERLKDILAIEVTVEYEIADGFFKDFFDITETFIEIDNLVKEMVGEQG